MKKLLFLTLSALLANTGYEKVRLNGQTVELPTGMELDLGAVGKGYAADETAQVLAEHGVESALLDFGGNILAMGSRPDGMPWRIGVRDPETDGTLGVWRSPTRAWWSPAAMSATLWGRTGSGTGTSWTRKPALPPGAA